jgi:hypothetical protein
MKVVCGALFLKSETDRGEALAVTIPAALRVY